MRNSWLKKARTIIFILVLSLVASSFDLNNIEKADADTAGINVLMPTQLDIVNYAAKHPTDNSVDIDGNLNPDYEIKYRNGGLDISEEINALNMIKLIRYIAGVSDDIYLSDEYTKMAQASVKVNYANGTLSHYPKTPDNVNPEIAKLGTRYSQDCNLAKYNHPNVSLKYTILDGWMDDSDSVNIQSMGHRRWILNPGMGMVGFGSVSDDKVTYNSMYVKDRSNAVHNETGVCWPAANTPVSYVNSNTPWSISVGEKIDAGKVKVKLVRASDKRTWKFSSKEADGDFYINNLDYGQTGCIIFRPGSISDYVEGDLFYVTVEGLQSEISYEVNFFDLEGYYAPPQPTLKSITLNSLDKPVIKWSSSYGASSYNLYRKTANGNWRLIKEDITSKSYTDSTAGKGLKYYYAVSSVKTVDKVDYSSAKSVADNITIKLPKVIISSAKAKGKTKNYISWKKISKATGYKVYRRVAGKSTWKLIKTTTKTNLTNISVASGKKYEYRVRAYRTCNGNTVYGTYSSVKTIKTK